MTSLESQYNNLHENVTHDIRSDGRDPRTGAERYRIVATPIPIHQIERNYMRNCDTLAGIFDGSIVESESFLRGSSRYGGKPVEHAIYLDKSSRPVQLLMRKTWSGLSEGVLPHASYRNIDKHNWVQLMSPDTENPDAPDIDRISLSNVSYLGPEAEGSLREQIARLRATYLSRSDLEKINESNVAEEVWNYPTTLDGKKVAIVDEVKSSGATLTIADLLLRAAVPEAKFEPVYWSTPGVLQWEVYSPEGDPLSREFMAKTVPVWYDGSSSYGRGIRDLNPVEAQLSESKKQRIGAYVLSLPYSQEVRMDSRSIAIREDLLRMAERFNSGQLEYLPSVDRSDRDFRLRVEQYYGMSYRDWLERRRSSKRVL